MKNLLYKEARLALHPTSILFLGLSAMLLIPNYPYYVTFFYTSLGIFFICLTGRENQDLLYTLLLPVSKSDAVRARMTLACLLELTQMAAAVPFAMLRSRMPLPGNQVGMDANTAFFGLAFLMLGIFNLAFFTRYYRNPVQVGKSFAWASVMEFLYIAAAETLTHAVPFFRDRLDTPDPAFLSAKLLVLCIGALGYAGMTLWAFQMAKRSFEKIDL